MKEQLAYTVPQFIGTCHVGRTKAYEEIASGRLVTYKVGRRRYISAHAITEWQRKLEAEAAAEADAANIDEAFRNPIIVGAV